MGYQSTREKVFEFLDKFIVPNIASRDFDYYKTVSSIITATGVSKNMIEDAIMAYIISGKLKEVRLIVATDETLKAYNVEQEKIKSEADKVIKEVINGENI